MKKSIKLNYIFNAGYQIFTIIVPLITAPYISRALGADGVGTYSYTFAIVSYFTLASTLGAGAFGNRQIAILQDNPIERSIEFWNVFIFRSFSTLIVTAFYLLYVIFIAQDKQIALLQSLYLLAVLIDTSWFLQGMELFKTISIRNFIFKIINVICIFAFVKSREDLPIYILCLAGITVISNLAVLPYTAKHIVKVPIKKLKPLKNTKQILQLFFPTIACNLYAIIDKSMIGWFSTSVENGYYEQADKIINMSLMLIIALSGVMLPRIANEVSKGNNDSVKMHMEKSCHLVWILGFPFTFGLIAISDFFVPIFFGEGYDKVKILLPVMSCLFILKGLNNTIGYQYLIATGKQNIYNRIILIGGAVNITANLLLIPKLYSMGATIGSIISEAIICILLMSYVSNKKLLEIKPIFASSVKCFASSLVMFAMLLLIKHFYADKIANLFYLIVTIIIAAIIYAVGLLELKDVLVADVLNSFLDKFRLKKSNK